MDTARVLAFASVDSTVHWTGRMKLIVNDERLGPVPQLVLAENLMKPRGVIHLFYCDQNWKVLGATSDDSIDEAKKRAERYYQGVTDRWVAAESTAEEIEKWFRKTPEGQAYVCSFCEGIPPEVDGLFANGAAAICFECVEDLNVQLHQQDGRV